MLVRELGEKELIQRIREKINSRSRRDPDLLCGIGDDAAAFKVGGDITLLTTDVLVDKVHFDAAGLEGKDLGYKAIAVNISDIAAMAGIPSYALITLGMPDDMEFEFIDMLYEGALEATELYDVAIIGGDITRSESLFIDVTIAGKVEKETLLRRSTAKKGDSIYVTGTLGASSLGLEAMTKPDMTGSHLIDRLISRHLRPEPRVMEGRLLASLGATSAEDISDGLITDLTHIAEESGVGFMLYEDKIPVDEDVTENSLQMTGKRPLEHAYFGGEDYELIVTGPLGLKDQYDSAASQEVYTPLNEIGVILAKEQGFKTRQKNGLVKDVEDRGYEHFAAHSKK